MGGCLPEMMLDNAQEGRYNAHTDHGGSQLDQPASHAPERPQVPPVPEYF